MYIHGVDDDVIIQSPSKVPPWLLVNKSLIPDLVIKDPKVGAHHEDNGGGVVGIGVQVYP